MILGVSGRAILKENIFDNFTRSAVTFRHAFSNSTITEDISAHTLWITKSMNMLLSVIIKMQFLKTNPDRERHMLIELGQPQHRPT